MLTVKVLFICLIFRLTFAGLWSLSVCKSSNLKQRALCREPTDPRGDEILSPLLHATSSPGGCGLQRAPQPLLRSAAHPPPALAFPQHRPSPLLPPGAQQSPAGESPAATRATCTTAALGATSPLSQHCCLLSLKHRGLLCCFVFFKTTLWKTVVRQRWHGHYLLFSRGELALVSAKRLHCQCLRFSAGACALPLLRVPKPFANI